MRQVAVVLLLAACGTDGSDVSSATSATTAGQAGAGGAGSGDGCPDVACPDPQGDSDSICDGSCGGTGCAAQVCQSLAVPIQNGTTRLYIPATTEQHPLCTANCAVTEVRWAIRFQLPSAATCVSVIVPEGVVWGTSGTEGGNDNPACFASAYCGGMYLYADDDVTRYVTIAVPEGVDIPVRTAVDIVVADATEGCEFTEQDVDALCGAVGCNGAGG